jgi:methyltransferase OMS1, mitochondrial
VVDDDGVVDVMARIRVTNKEQSRSTGTSRFTIYFRHIPSIDSISLRRATVMRVVTAATLPVVVGGALVGAAMVSWNGRRPRAQDPRALPEERDRIPPEGHRRALLLTTTILLFGTPPVPTWAWTPVEAERQYNAYAAHYDVLDGGPAAALFGINAARRQQLSSARGRVLEVGVGTGLNLDQYPVDNGISALTLVDISEAMLRATEAKLKQRPQWRDVRLVRADVTRGPLLEEHLGGDAAFDTVVDSFSLCVLGTDGAERALEQMRRVVRPQAQGGQLLLLENSRASNPWLGWYQDATADVVAAVGGKGCVYNQDVGRLIRSNGGLTIVEETEFAAGLFRFFRVVRND